jgi:branched-subunit amino acid transport protein AzlD
MIVFELIAVRAVNWFHEVYSISLFIAISLIVMMRWGVWSIISIIAGAISYCLVNDAVFENYIIYIFGNLFILINLFWFLLGKDRIRKGYWTVLFVLSGYVLVEIGRSLVAVFFGGKFIPTLIGFLGTDLINALLALLIIIITRKQNGLFEDQISYLKRINEEERNQNANTEV